jgi:hypothetical protein
MSVTASTDRYSMRQVSPELVLVDPVLARRERMLLGEPPTASTRLSREPLEGTVRNQSASSVGSPTTEDAAPSSSAETDSVGAEPEVPDRRALFPFSFPDDAHYLGVREPQPLTTIATTAFDLEPVPSVRAASETHFRRLSTFVPVSSAAAATAIFMLQLYLGHGGLA